MLRGQKARLVSIWTLQWCKANSEISWQIQTILLPGLLPFLPLKSQCSKSRDRTSQLGKVVLRQLKRRTVPSILALMNSSRSHKLEQLIMLNTLKPLSLPTKESNLGFCLLCKDWCSKELSLIRCQDPLRLTETVTFILFKGLKIPNSKDCSISSSTWYTIRRILWWDPQILQVAFCYSPSQLTVQTILAD